MRTADCQFPGVLPHPHSVFNGCSPACLIAVLVWARALGLLTPLSSKLGAMMYILRRAAEEVVVLVPVVLVLMLVSHSGTVLLSDLIQDRRLASRCARSVSSHSSGRCQSQPPVRIICQRPDEKQFPPCCNSRCVMVWLLVCPQRSLGFTFQPQAGTEYLRCCRRASAQRSLSPTTASFPVTARWLGHCVSW